MGENDDLDRLNVRVPLEGVPADPAALVGNPFERKATWRSALRAAGSRAWIAAALAAGVIALGWHLRPATPTDETSSLSTESIARLTAADPRALRQQIVSELRTAGVEAMGYAQLGINGIDADLPRPVTPAMRLVLEKHRIPVPPNGVLRIEISSPENR